MLRKALDQHIHCQKCKPMLFSNLFLALNMLKHPDVPFIAKHWKNRKISVGEIFSVVCNHKQGKFRTSMTDLQD